MKRNCVLLSAILTFLLAACDENSPSDKLSSEVVRPYAESSLVKGLELTDYKRDNGWVDTEAPNRYKVQYAFNYKLTKPLAEVVLDLAKEYKRELDDSKKNPGFMGVDAMQASLNTSVGASQWVNAQGDNFKVRRDKFLGQCEPCINYWNQDGPKDEIKAMRETYILAWAYLESLGFSDSAAVGDKVSRSAWAAFIKTEKGWVAAK